MFVKPALIDATKHPALFAELPDAQRGTARLKVIDPVRKDILPDEGRDVTDHHYWHRRLRDGDVTPCNATEIAALTEAAKPRDTPPAE